jgi:hypothetical protein
MPYSVDGRDVIETTACSRATAPTVRSLTVNRLRGAKSAERPKP